MGGSSIYRCTQPRNPADIVSVSVGCIRHISYEKLIYSVLGLFSTYPTGDIVDINAKAR